MPLRYPQSGRRDQAWTQSHKNGRGTGSPGRPRGLAWLRVGSARPERPRRFMGDKVSLRLLSVSRKHGGKFISTRAGRCEVLKFE